MTLAWKSKCCRLQLHTDLLLSHVLDRCCPRSFSFRFIFFVYLFAKFFSVICNSQLFDWIMSGYSAELFVENVDQEFLCGIWWVNVFLHFLQQCLNSLPTLHGMVSMTLQSSDSPSLAYRGLFLRGRSVVQLQTTWYALGNCSRYICLKIIYSHTRSYLNILKNDFSRVSSHCPKWGNNPPKLKMSI